MWNDDYKKFSCADILNNYKNDNAANGSKYYPKDIDEDNEKPYSYFFVINDNYVIEKHKLKYLDHWDVIFTINDYSKYGSFSTDIEYIINSKYIFFTIEDAVAARYAYISEKLEGIKKNCEKYSSAKKRAENGEIVYNIKIDDRGNASLTLSPNSSGWRISDDDSTILDSAICLVSKFFGDEIKKFNDEYNELIKFKTLSIDYINGWKKEKEA